MKLSLEETLTEVWRQTLVEDAKVVPLGTARYPVRKTPRKGLREVAFAFNGNEIRALEQNPGDEIAVGANGPVWQEGDAVPKRGPLRGKRG